MNIATLGFYQFYCTYCHWRSQRIRNGERMYAFWRASFFYIFYIHNLFNRIARTSLEQGLKPAWRPMLHATILVLVCIFSGALSALTDKLDILPLWLILSQLFFIILWTYSFCCAQIQINRLSTAMNYGIDSKITIWNILFVLGYWCFLFLSVAAGI